MQACWPKPFRNRRLERCRVRQCAARGTRSASPAAMSSIVAVLPRRWQLHAPRVHRVHGRRRPLGGCTGAVDLGMVPGGIDPMISADATCWANRMPECTTARCILAARVLFSARSSRAPRRSSTLNHLTGPAFGNGGSRSRTSALTNMLRFRSRVRSLVIRLWFTSRPPDGESCSSNVDGIAPQPPRVLH